METILIVADSETAGRFKSALRDAVTASDIADCLDKLSSIRIGLLIVSMKLPGSAGLCTDLRKRFDFPIITISASGEKSDLLTGLSLGDDCVPPDCPPELLKARVNAKLRLARDPEEIVAYRDLRLDALSGTALIRGKNLRLTQREFAILLYLAKNAETIVDRSELYSAVWGQMPGDQNALWLTISRLKQKLMSDSTGLTITAVRGRGYMLEQF